MHTKQHNIIIVLTNQRFGTINGSWSDITHLFLYHPQQKHHVESIKILTLYSLTDGDASRGAKIRSGNLHKIWKFTWPYDTGIVSSTKLIELLNNMLLKDPLRIRHQSRLVPCHLLIRIYPTRNCPFDSRLPRNFIRAFNDSVPSAPSTRLSLSIHA